MEQKGKLVIVKNATAFAVESDQGFDWEAFAAYLRARLDDNPALTLSYLAGAGRPGATLKFLVGGG